MFTYKDFPCGAFYWWWQNPNETLCWERGICSHHLQRLFPPPSGTWNFYTCGYGNEMLNHICSRAFNVTMSQWCGVDVAPEPPWDAKHLSQREGKSSCWWWPISSVPRIRLLGLDQVPLACSANDPRQGRAHHGDQPFFKTQIVFIFVQCYWLWRKSQAVVFFHVNFSPCTKGGVRNSAVREMVSAGEAFVQLWDSSVQKGRWICRVSHLCSRK